MAILIFRGVGWASGVGRIGAVLGPIAGGLMVGAHVPLAAIFAALALPRIAAAVMRISVN